MTMSMCRILQCLALGIHSNTLHSFFGLRPARSLPPHFTSLPTPRSHHFDPTTTPPPPHSRHHAPTSSSLPRLRSICIDVPWMGVADLFGAENGEADNAQLLRASKTSKLGARAGRVGKIVKLIRSVRLLRVIRQVYSIQRTRKKKQLDKKMDEMGLCSPVVIAKGEGGGGKDAGKDKGGSTSAEGISAKHTMQDVVAKALEHKVALKHNDALKARTQGTSQVAEQTGEMISLRVAVLVMLACIVSPLLQWQDFDEGKTAYVAMLESFPASREWHQDPGSFSLDPSATGNTAASRSWNPASVHAVYDTTAAQIRAMYQSTLTIPLSLAVSFADGGANSTSTNGTNGSTSKLTTSSTSTPAGNGSNATSQWSWDSARPARSSFLSTLKSPRVTLLFNNGPLKRQEAAYSCLLMLFIIVVLLVWSSNLNLVLHRMLIAPVHRTLAIIKAGATKVIEMSRTEGDEGEDMLAEFEGSVGVLDEVEQIELMLAKMTRLLASGDLNARSASARVAEMIRVQDVKDDDVKDWLYVTYTNTKGTGGQRSGDGEDGGGGRGKGARQNGGSGRGVKTSHSFVVASTTTARDDIEDGPLEGSFVQYEENESTVATSTNNGRSTTSPNQLDSYTRADGTGAGALGGIGGVIGGGIVAGSPRSLLASGGFSISEVKLSAWTYSTYQYPEEVLILHMVAIYEIMGVMTLLDRNTIIAFTDRIRRLYLEVPYHNFRHAMDVVQAIFWVLQRVDARSWLPMDDIMALLTAALCHDVCHPGVNNAFLINTQHELALTYNDQCPLESMHCATAFQVMEDDEVNLFHRLNEQQFRWVRAYMVDAILATDGAHHFKMLAELQAFKEKNHIGKHGKIQSGFLQETVASSASSSSRGEGGGKRRNAMWARDKWKLAAKKIRAAGRFGGGSGGGGAWGDGGQHRKKPRQQMWCEGPESRLLFGRMMLHTADISNPARPFKECAKLAVLVMEEFYSRKLLRVARSFVQPVDTRVVATLSPSLHIIHGAWFL